MLAAASAAAVMHIPVNPHSRARSSEGAVDDSFPPCYHQNGIAPSDRHRNISPSRDPDGRNAGGSNQHKTIGVWNGDNTGLMSRAELESDLGFSLEPPLALVTYHPATNDHKATPTNG